MTVEVLILINEKQKSNGFPIKMRLFKYNKLNKSD